MLLKPVNWKLKSWWLFAVTSYRFDVQLQNALILSIGLYDLFWSANMAYSEASNKNRLKRQQWQKLICFTSGLQTLYACSMASRNELQSLRAFLGGLSHGLLNSTPLLLLENSWPVVSNILGWISANTSLTALPHFFTWANVLLLVNIWDRK